MNFVVKYLMIFLPEDKYKIFILINDFSCQLQKREKDYSADNDIIYCKRLIICTDFFILMKHLSFDFLKLLFSKVSQQSKWCFIHVLHSSTYNFRQNSFNFCTSRFDNLINSILCNFVDLSCSLIDNVGSYLPSWLTVSLPVYTKLYLLRKSSLC